MVQRYGRVVAFWLRFLRAAQACAFVAGRAGLPRRSASSLERAGKADGFGMKIHPHMLRHACGYKLANDGGDTRTIQAYLGHKSIQHTVRYTELAPTRFKSLFRDLAVRCISSKTSTTLPERPTRSQIQYLPLTPGFFVGIGRGSVYRALESAGPRGPRNHWP